MNSSSIVPASLPESLECGTLEALEAQSATINMAIAKKKKEMEVISKFGKPYQAIKKDRKGNPVMYYRVDYRDGDGKRQQCCATTWDELINRLAQKMEDGDFDRLDPNATVEDVFEKLKKERAKMVEAGTISSQTAEYDIYNWNRFFANRNFIHRPIKTISTEFLKREYRLMCGDGTKYTRKAFDKAKTLMSNVFSIALMDGIITVNFASLVPLDLCKFIIKDTSEEAQEDEYYSQEAVQKLRDYIRSLPKGTYSLGILLHTYLVSRVGETRALTWDDYNAETGEMKIWHEIIQKKIGDKKRADFDAPHTKSCKSQGRREVTLPDEAMEVVEELRKINGDKKYILNGCRGAKFSIPTNKFNEHLRSYCEACGVTYHSSHKFRFYGITRMYEIGVDEDCIQYTAGHTTPDMTRHYDKSRSKSKKVSRDIMASL